ncbi:MAG: DUF4347 domain-containing protein [Myxococcaceae bacterium]|nr:DUF4347 domain-containing protein [Myxococcaceae bacterium]
MSIAPINKPSASSITQALGSLVETAKAEVEKLLDTSLESTFTGGAAKKGPELSGGATTPVTASAGPTFSVAQALRYGGAPTPAPAAGVSPPPPPPPGASTAPAAKASKVDAPTVSGDPVSVHYIAPDEGAVAWLMEATTIGEVQADSVKGMVDGIIADADGHPIDHLEIEGHGSPGSQVIAKGVKLEHPLTDDQKAELLRLKPHLTKDAVVVLDGCQVGAGNDGEALLKEMSELLGVKVKAGTGYQRLTPGIEGSEVTATPDGKGGSTISTDESDWNEFWRLNPGFDDDDKWMEALGKVDDKGLQGMPQQSRYNAVKTLISGYTGEDEGNQVLRIFENATPEQRKELYRQLEGHAWGGDFKNGVLTDDDGLVDALDNDQLAKLRGLMNE